MYEEYNLEDRRAAIELYRTLDAAGQEAFLRQFLSNLTSKDSAARKLALRGHLRPTAKGNLPDLLLNLFNKIDKPSSLYSFHGGPILDFISHAFASEKEVTTLSEEQRELIKTAAETFFPVEFFTRKYGQRGCYAQLAQMASLQPGTLQNVIQTGFITWDNAHNILAYVLALARITKNSDLEKRILKTFPDKNFKYAQFGLETNPSVVEDYRNRLFPENRLPTGKEWDKIQQYILHYLNQKHCTVKDMFPKADNKILGYIATFCYGVNHYQVPRDLKKLEIIHKMLEEIQFDNPDLNDFSETPVLELIRPRLRGVIAQQGMKAHHTTQDNYLANKETALSIMNISLSKGFGPNEYAKVPQYLLIAGRNADLNKKDVATIWLRTKPALILNQLLAAVQRASGRLKQKDSLAHS